MTAATDIQTTNNQMTTAGRVANVLAANATFADYTSRKADSTIANQLADLKRFAEYLTEVGVSGCDAETLQTLPDCWHGVTWGIVEGFVKWQLVKGFSVGTVNRRLSTIKTYAKLAAKAGAIDSAEYQLIKAVSGYGQKETKRINERRDVSRIGHKKAEHVSIGVKQAQLLKSQPDTPQGRRDALLMCLLLDHGLRVSEVELLTVADFNLKLGEMVFYRPKVDKTQTHKLTADTLRALTTYIEEGALAIGRILRGSSKSGELTGAMSARAITKRVAYLGMTQLGLFRLKDATNKAGEIYKIKVGTLSAHDCRHYWATDAARNHTNAFALRDAGGWSSMAMPSRYVEAAKIANEGVKLSK